MFDELVAPLLDQAREIATRENRDASQSSSSFEFNEENVLLALDFETACSPVLRAAARSIIEDTEE